MTVRGEVGEADRSSLRWMEDGQSIYMSWDLADEPTATLNAADLAAIADSAL